jgi:hypothetical protein
MPLNVQEFWPLPWENLEAYRLMFAIENGLRELIIDELSSLFGSHWYKSRLPGDVFKKYKDARTFERTIGWVKLVPHHPMYYVDFPDLSKIILRDDNWKESFAKFFQRKDFVLSTLGQLDFVRNKIAHNRKASTGDVLSIQAAYAWLANSVGETRFKGLSSRCTVNEEILQLLSDLQSLAARAFSDCQRYAPVRDLSSWFAAKDQWWFDETYLGDPIDAIVSFFNLIDSYNRLPRSRGRGHEIERWVVENRMQQVFNDSQLQFSRLLESK